MQRALLQSPLLYLDWRCEIPGFNVPSGGGTVVGSPTSLQETARRHRWKLEIEPNDYTGSDFGDIEIFAHKATRPTPEIDVITIHHSQDEVYLPGKNRWAPIEITFYEIAKKTGNATAAALYQWWSKEVINLVRSRIAWGRLKRECTLTQLNGIGRGIYEYKLYGCWPEKVTPEDLNFDESTICEIVLRLRYDKAVEKSLTPEFWDSRGSTHENPRSPYYDAG